MLSWLLDNKRRRDLGLKQQVADVIERLHRLEMSHQQVLEQYDRLQAAHNKLRGAYYGSKGAAEKAAEGGEERESKADYAKRVGLVPGRPFNHRSQQ